METCKKGEKRKFEAAVQTEENGGDTESEQKKRKVAGMQDESEHPRILIPELLRLMYRLGWVSGTGGGLSMEYEGKIYIAPSGVQKERVQSEDLFVYNRETQEILSKPRNPVLKPSDCTPLFFNAYAVGAGAVVHSHSLNAMLVTLLFDREFKVSQLEMIKGIKGLGYYDQLVVPIIENTAFERELTSSMAEAMKQYPKAIAVLVRRHGIYVWGDDWKQAKRHAECLDYLFEAVLRMKQLGISYEVTVSKT